MEFWNCWILRDPRSENWIGICLAISLSILQPWWMLDRKATVMIKLGPTIGCGQNYIAMIVIQKFPAIRTPQKVVLAFFQGRQLSIPCPKFMNILHWQQLFGWFPFRQCFLTTLFSHFPTGIIQCLRLVKLQKMPKNKTYLEHWQKDKSISSLYLNHWVCWSSFRLEIALESLLYIS